MFDRVQLKFLAFLTTGRSTSDSGRAYSSDVIGLPFILHSISTESIQNVDFDAQNSWFDWVGEVSEADADTQPGGWSQCAGRQPRRNSEIPARLLLVIRCSAPAEAGFYARDVFQSQLFFLESAWP
jgi:hypothetical protein